MSSCHLARFGAFYNITSRFASGQALLRSPLRNEVWSAFTVISHIHSPVFLTGILRWAHTEQKKCHMCYQHWKRNHETMSCGLLWRRNDRGNEYKTQHLSRPWSPSALSVIDEIWRTWAWEKKKTFDKYSVVWDSQNDGGSQVTDILPLWGVGPSRGLLWRGK